MKPTHIQVAIGLFIASVSVVFGQTTKLDAPDQAFIDLTAAARPLPIAPPAAGTKKTRDQFVRDQQMQSAAFLAAADQAKDFYTRYPSHTKAAEAKKIEVISSLRAVQTGAVASEPKALRLAREYRSDDNNASFDRYIVATVVTQIDLSKKKITERTALLAEYEKRAMDLYGEFPNEPAVMEMMLGVAQNADAEQARSLAGRILRMPAADRVKAEAQAVIDRLDMPGKAVAFEWQDDTGKFHTMADHKGNVVIFYVWATWSGASEAANARIASDLKPGMELVSVNVDIQIEKAKAAKAKAPFSGISYYDERGLSGPLPKQLRVLKVPSVYVVDSAGIFIGSGNPSDLPSLLAKTGK